MRRPVRPARRCPTLISGRSRMDSSSSLHLDEHLARFLAAYDQGIGGGDGKAPTLDLPYLPPAGGLSPPPGERSDGPLPSEGPHQGLLSDLLPDSQPTDSVLPSPDPVGSPHT